MSNTQLDINEAAQKAQKGKQLLWTIWCIFVVSLSGFSHALDRYHDNIKHQRQQEFARAIARTVKPQPVFHVELDRDKATGSQADAVLHRKR
jgi:hypothetical protein